MKLCGETITVFNAKYNPETDMDDYIGTVITGVSWFREVVSTVNETGLKAADKVTVRIPEDADFGSKQYVSPVDYANTKNDSVFTLKSGDIVVRGAIAGTGFVPSALHRDYEAFTILGVTDARRGNRGRHWKVVGS